MDLKVLSVILCETVRDEGNGIYSYMNSFSNLAPKSFPALYTKIAFVTVWTGAVGVFTLQTKIVAPDGKPITEQDATVFTLTDPEHRFCHTVNAENVVFPVPGLYAFESRINGELMLSYPFAVTKEIVKVGSGIVPAFSLN